MSRHDRPAREGDEGARQRRRGSLDPVELYHRRTARIRDEIARNRRGDYTVPTWVLALALAGMVGLWVLVLFVI
ncbi:hypothetical protein [Glycomyces xiaoerkulensis]|uniref:hypothetical protein n=1 Tax=Glycomyces xiaoerkulensis TaxID=2038139 RepID=UPI000C268232|nr:hypothetical protein [Glycomyces xiaoerkulensis]